MIKTTNARVKWRVAYLSPGVRLELFSGFIILPLKSVNILPTT